MDKRIAAACKIEGCSVDDLLFSRVRDDGAVVLIIKPGRKRIVELPAVAEPAPLPEMTVITKPKPTFAQVIGVRVRLVLEREGLMDADKLRKMQDFELEGIDGIGSKSVQQIREALDVSQ